MSTVGSLDRAERCVGDAVRRAMFSYYYVSRTMNPARAHRVDRLVVFTHYEDRAVRVVHTLRGNRAHHEALETPDAA